MRSHKRTRRKLKYIHRPQPRGRIMRRVRTEYPAAAYSEPQAEAPAQLRSSRRSGSRARLVFMALLIIAASMVPRSAGEPAARTGEAVISVYDTMANALISLPLEVYVERALAAEMPASYNEEALKAQAVAARTRAVAGYCVRYPAANVCTDSGCCQAYLTVEKQRERWKADFDLFFTKVTRAVQDTANVIITYEGDPILVLYHAVSGGRTEDVELVFAQSLPYLRSVESAGEENASRYESRQTFTRQAFADGVNASFSKANLTADKLESQVEILERSDSGRVLKVKLGGAETEGRRLRSTLSLYSANFAFEFTPENVIVNERGYGHGVGMSQAGAQAMAEAGSDFRKILKHYYTGVDIDYWNGSSE